METSVRALKLLDAGAIGPYSGFKWPKPRGSRPGKWVHVDGDLKMCKRGIHACTFEQATAWLREECYVIELRGVVSDDGEKMLARSGRLVRRVDGWDHRVMVRFAADCAAHVLPIFEQRYPKDDRPRKAIAAARRWARSPSRKSADAAHDAARAAAAHAAYAAYAADAYATAVAAARTAAHAADAVVAARTAVHAAAYAAHAAAAVDAERAWQVKHLRRYIEAPEVAR